MGLDACAAWDYQGQPGAATVATTCAEFIQKIRAAPDSQISALRDTRPFHAAMFKAAVPSACAYLAGNYRGSDHSCLKHRQVGMGKRAGAPSSDVGRLMTDFHSAARLSLRALESRLGNRPAPSDPFTLQAFLLETIC